MRRVCLAALGLLLVSSLAHAQGDPSSNWTFRTRLVMTGVSDSSDPEGYKVYSGFGLEGEFSRALTERLAVSWTFSTLSREVELQSASGGKTNLGSIEVMPLNLLLQFRPRPGGRFHPAIGLGAHVTPFWEKSGALDSSDLTVGIGPVGQIGFDYDLSSRVVLSADFRVSYLKTDLEANGTKVATIDLHPSTLGVGIGFRF